MQRVEQLPRRLPLVAHRGIPGARVESPRLAARREVGNGPEGLEHALERIEPTAPSLPLQGHDGRLRHADQRCQLTLADAAPSTERGKPTAYAIAGLLSCPLSANSRWRGR